jgi:hypothetical protein
MLRRLFVAGLCTAAAAVLAAPAAQGRAYVVHEKGIQSGPFDSGLCSFSTTTNGYDDVTVIAKGKVTKTVDKFRGTITGPSGVKLVETEDAVITDDSVTGNQTWNGVAQSFSYAGGKPIAKDVGEITFDSSGNIVSEHGPHPIADGPGADAVCAVLGP